MQQRQGRSGRGVAFLAIPLLILLWLLWNAAAPDVTDGTVAAETPPPPEPERPVLARVERPVTAERADLTEPVPVLAPPPDLEHPCSYALDLRLVDAFGLPVPGAMVFAAPPLCGFSLWPGLSNSRGEVRLRWQGRVGRMQLQVATMAWGVLQPLRLFELDAERTDAKVLVVRGREQSEETLARLRQHTPEMEREFTRHVRRGRMRMSDELDVMCGRSMLLFREFECGACHEPSRIAGYATLARCGVIARSLHPSATFQDLGAGSLTDAQRRERQRMLEEGEGDQAEKRRQQQERGWVITGVVREPDGKPAAQVPVAWLSENGALNKRTWTNANGQYRLQPVPLGMLTLVAGGGDGGDAKTVAIVNYATTQCDFQLQRSSVIRGSARDEGGGVLVDWRVEYERDEGDWADLAMTHKDGGFLLPSVPGLGRCLLWPNDANLRLPVAFGRVAAPDNEPMTFRLDPQIPTRARLRLRVVFPGAKGTPPVDARLFQLDTGRGAVVPPSRFDDQLELGGLAAGPYRFEVGSPTHGWVDGVSRHVDGRGLWDLGSVTLPAPGRVKLRLPLGQNSPLQSEHAVYRRLESMDVLVHTEKGTEDTLVMPAGEHLLLWRDKDKTEVRALSFTVTAGAQLELDIPPGDPRPLPR